MHLNTPSQFLQEIPANLLEEVKVVEEDESDLGDLNDGNVQYLPEV